MDELIKINYDKEEPTVSARDLYDSLSNEDGAKGTERFSKWFERYCGYGFTEGEDYSNPYQKVRVQKEGNREVQREVEDYDLSIDMAKQICMLQKTERGKQIRQYFIDLDKAWNTPEQVMARALKMAGKTIDSLKERCGFLGSQIIEKQKQIEEMQPKATYYDLILQCPDLVSTTVIAKDYGMSAAKFNGCFHDFGIQFKQSDVWVLYREYDHFGYTSTKTHNYSDTNGNQHSRPHTYWTQKGRLFLYNFLKNRGIVPAIERSGSR